jgi:hypothetical protein
MQAGDRFADRDIKLKIRLDFKGINKPGRLLFGGKTVEKAAEETREQQVALFRNVPMPGLYIEDIDMSNDIYTVIDEITGAEVAFAPVVLTITADSLEDAARFIAREDFRKVEIIEPNTMTLTRYDLERLMYKIHEEFRSFQKQLERKYTSR